MENLKAKAKQLKKEIPAVLFALRDRETPILAKLLAALTVAYALSPIDLIPDFIPVLGYLDDLLLLPLLITLTVKLIPSRVWQRSREQAAKVREEKAPKRWYYALPILAIWLILILLLVKAIWF